MAVKVYARWEEPPEVAEQEWRVQTLPALRSMIADATRTALIGLPLALLAVSLLGPHDLPFLLRVAASLVCGVGILAFLPTLLAGALFRPKSGVGRECLLDGRGLARGNLRVSWRLVSAYTIAEDPRWPGVGALTVKAWGYAQDITLRFRQSDLEAAEIQRLLKILAPNAEPSVTLSSSRDTFGRETTQ